MYCDILEDGPLIEQSKQTPTKTLVISNDNSYNTSIIDNDIKENPSNSPQDALFKATKRHIGTARTGANSTDLDILAYF